MDEGGLIVMYSLPRAKDISRVQGAWSIICERLVNPIAMLLSCSQWFINPIVGASSCNSIDCEILSV